MALHMHPQYWVDLEKWKPQRWITRVTKECADRDEAREALLKPRRGTYFLWSEGPMNCPGLKVSADGFTAVISCMMRSCRLSVVRDSSESEGQVRQRVSKVVDDYDDQMLLRMRDPRRVRVRCGKRSEL